MSQFVPPPEVPALVRIQEKESAILLGPAISVGEKNPTIYPGNITVEPSIQLVTRERAKGVTRYRLTPLYSNTDSQSPTVIEIPDTVEIIADRKEYDEQQQVIVASGNVVMRFGNAVLRADVLRVNLPYRVAVAQGNVVLTRGEQVLSGENFEYFFFRDNGVIFNASGEIYLPALSRDTATTLPTDEGASTLSDIPLSDRLEDNQPLRRVSAAEGYKFVLGSTRDLSLLRERSGLAGGDSGGQVNRLRFQADRLEFDTLGWQATNLRLTNDPFSPPELEVRADTAKLRNIAPRVNELTTTNSRIVFDQNLSLPIFQNRLVFDDRPRQPTLVQFGFDGEERGGLFVERAFNLIDTQKVNFKLTPQYFLQRAIIPDAFGLSDPNESGSIIRPSAFGVKARFDVDFTPRTELRASSDLTSLDFGNIKDELRANIGLQQKIGDLDRPHTLSFKYNYRDRLFNGSLGFQRVQSSLGVLLTSPAIALGRSGVFLSYQGSIQNIDAETDRRELIVANNGKDIINLTRYQGAASLSRQFSLWEGEALPPTAKEGLRYTPVPIRPFLQLSTGVTGVASFYSNGENQPSLLGSIGFLGQLGHFSRSFLDYTGFNIGYNQGIRGDASPFKFDRFVDAKTLSLGITQQIYGPFRLGFQTSLNLDNNEQISTDYFLEYSRRTYNIIVRYNPVLSIGSIGFRISDFNWIGEPEPFGGSGVRPITQGVER